MNEELASPESSPNLENLTPEQLAELVSTPEMRGSVWAEVHRRLKDDPRKANFLTFRWFLPADEADQADAFRGLMCCCWNATEKRIFPFGLFPHDSSQTSGPNRALLGGSIARETQEDIENALVECLWRLRTLSPPELILIALNGGFHTDVDVGNAVRRKVREESRHLSKYGSDAVSKDDEGGYGTLFEVLPDSVDRANHYNEAVEIILQERAQVVEELGEKGWEVLEEIVEHEDQGMLPMTKRDRQRLLTEMFQTAYGVCERQARTHKSRFLEAIEAGASEGKPVFECIEELLAMLRCWDRKKS
jgi:hypothetical protein